MSAPKSISLLSRKRNEFFSDHRKTDGIIAFMVEQGEDSYTTTEIERGCCVAAAGYGMTRIEGGAVRPLMDELDENGYVTHTGEKKQRRHMLTEAGKERYREVIVPELKEHLGDMAEQDLMLTKVTAASIAPISDAPRALQEKLRDGKGEELKP